MTIFDTTGVVDNAATNKCVWVRLVGAHCLPMPAALLPFRLLSPAQYALLSAVEKTEYLRRLVADIKAHTRRFRADNRRLVHWLLHKDDMRGPK